MFPVCLEALKKAPLRSPAFVLTVGFTTRRSPMLIDAQLRTFPPMAFSMAQRSMPAEDYQRFAATRLYEITYLNEGLQIKGWLAVPPQETATMPAIIYNRGGSGPKAALTPLSAAATIGLCASWGFVAVASQYRGVGGSEGREEWGDGDARDSLALLQVLQQLSYVDMDRIGVIGGSRGGVVTFLMLKHSDAFRAAITYGAPTSLHDTPADSYIRQMLRPFLPPNADEAAELRKRSVVLWADQLCRTTPLLVLHGAGDRRVNPIDALKLGIALQEIHFPYRLIIYDNADHILSGQRQESNAQMRQWMERFVRDRAPLPRTGPFGA